MRRTFTRDHPDCIVTRASLDAYLASGDRLHERPALARHLQVCADCHARYAEALVVAARHVREQRARPMPSARPATAKRSASNRQRVLLSALVLVLVARFDPLHASSRLEDFAGQVFVLAYNALQGNALDGGDEIARPTEP